MTWSDPCPAVVVDEGAGVLTEESRQNSHGNSEPFLAIAVTSTDAILTSATWTPPKPGRAPTLSGPLKRVFPHLQHPCSYERVLFHTSSSKT